MKLRFQRWLVLSLAEEKNVGLSWELTLKGGSIYLSGENVSKDGEGVWGGDAQCGGEMVFAWVASVGRF